MTQVEKIKAEIEKLRDYQISCIKNDYRLTGKPEENIILECNKLLSFINSIQAEPVSEDLNEVITKLKTKISMCNCFNKKNREEVFALLDTIKKPKKEVSEDLEEACEQLAENARKHKAETLSPFFSPIDYKQGVIDGANWQKEQMLKDAISCKVFWHDMPLLDYTQERQDEVLEKIGANVGDKVKLIIIKEN